MVDRPYHDYSTGALRELTMDLMASQVELEDQRADYVKRADLDDDELRKFDVVIKDLGHELVAVDHELATRERDTPAASASGQRAIPAPPRRLRAYSPRVMRVDPKPHCRAKRVSAAASGHHWAGLHDAPPSAS